MSLDTKRQGWIWALGSTAQVIVIDLLYGLEIDDSLQLGLMFVYVVGKCSLQPVKDEPALLPRLDLASHFDEVALTHLLVDDDKRAGVHAVS